MAQEACCLWSVWADLLVPKVVTLYCGRFSFVVARLWWEAFVPGAGE